MTLDWITAPLSDDEPAGPDLWADDDAVFNEYYFDAVARLPEADDYAKVGLGMGDGDKQPDVIFNPKSVALANETAQIDGMLKRSRDLRLLTLRAQWSILAGDIDQTSDSVCAMADLLDQMPDAVHPVVDGPPRDRLEAINDLATVGAMILPLRYYDIGGTGTSLRRMMVARGQFTAHDGEEDLSIDAMIGAMSKSRESVTLAHAALTDFRAALTRIEIACLSHPTPHTPQLKTLAQEIEAVLAVIADADPNLAAKSKAAGDGAPLASTEASVSKTDAATVAVATEVKSHDEARRRLTAVETYFGRYEPSSAAVLLVTQARLLIGKSLVDAFDILMPESAERAAVDFISDSGFRLAHQQLRDLANQVMIEGETPHHPVEQPAELTTPVTGDDEENETVDHDDDSAADEDHDDIGQDDTDQDRQGGENDATEPEKLGAPFVKTSISVAQSKTDPAFLVPDAGVAASQILAVETYFRAREKSSPIPMLLARARSYIGKDFETLLRELVPKIE